jgi:hypothetical protein
MTNAVSAAPTYSNAAVESGPASRPASATIGVVAPNATAATAARSAPVASGERFTWPFWHPPRRLSKIYD